MKKFLFILPLIPLPLLAQISVTPIAGLSSIRMTQAYGYEKGGNYGIVGAEVELNLKSKGYSPFNISFVSGVSYLSNGFARNFSFSYTALNYYDAQSTNLQMKYLQVPLIMRLNFRPFPLVEDWRIFIGAGLSFSNLMQAHMAEQWTRVSTFNNAFSYLPVTPVVSEAHDDRDVLSYANKNSMFERFEIGMKFKHVQITFRLSASMQDMYFKGIENVWQVPADHSLYLDAHNTEGIIKEKYTEIIFGWRL